MNRTVTIAMPVRNREWILDEYLKSLLNLNYPTNLIEFIFVINDSTDNSLNILKKFKKQNKDKYRNIKIEVYNRNAPVDKRDLNIRNNFIYTHLSKLRNYIMSKTKTDYLMFIDTDILIQPDIINNLLKHNKDIVSGLIWNGYVVRPEKPYLYPNIMKLNNKGYFEHIVNNQVKNAPLVSSPTLMEVDLTGAVILLSRKVYKSVKYGFHPQGEDAYFCKMAQNKGFELFCDLSVFSNHIMSPEYLREFLNETKNNTLSTHP
ncbi:glycosyltransferase family 2 protein [Paenibacillus sp. EKM202P]|uniref:glycosyltransferase n=1 Tax=unclassified Paenibacillus TaxID=185978 RepID=UPI0013EC09E4|nr:MULTISPECIES: glycosyltransferase family A protein [unclassified Paenibacillus]KAF6565451.1 glycosyltransferase family 2 protein [Paenibacillus sp. EKM202P]KAF6569224.1 glycosyltransferase family 2 protein [Paenibacillus sp. EKM207P]